jgi:predicted NBD/HSP70 family sugar kinase
VRALGVNVGTTAIRAVEVFALNDVAEGEARAITATRSLNHMTRREFASLLGEPEQYDRVDIAWSAPRINGRLVPESTGLRDVGEIAVSMARGSLDEQLSELCRCKVSSWHDGAAACAGEEWAARRTEHDRPVLTLKLGTSFGAGLVREGRVCGLPMQLAKCLLPGRSRSTWQHPIVGIEGTARDALGARGIGNAYATRSGGTGVGFQEFVGGVADGDPVAVKLVRASAETICDLLEFVGRMLPLPDLVLTGQNLEASAFNARLRDEIWSESARRGLDFGLLDSQLSFSGVAAIGAVVLGVGKDEALET